MRRQRKTTYTSKIKSFAQLFGNRAMELYFETPDMDGFIDKLSQNAEISYVHPLKEHRQGQRVVRIFDPDGHIVEIGEAMSCVVRRFSESGLTPEQIATRMDVPLSYGLAQFDA